MSGRTALVLAGGAARGAYEVGVALHLVEDVARTLGRDVPLDILSGTSVGAINASVLAAFADEPRARGRRLASHWMNLKMDDVVQPDARGLFDSIRSLFGGRPRTRATDRRRGGILNPAGLERIVNRATPFHRIREHLRDGRLKALTISTTHVGSGRTVVFVEQGPDGPRFAASDPTVVGVPAEIEAEHALASAAIPLLFPSVRIGDGFYCDGGVRQNVPLMPALRLGADALIVVSPRYVDPAPPHVVAAPLDDARDYPGPLYLVGKALNALLLDHVENDLVQLERINRLLDAGTRRYGDGFVDEINRELGVAPGGSRMRPARTVLISASQDLGRMAADYVRSPRFGARVSGLVGRALRRIAEGSGDHDLLSYLLFDGPFAAELIELGRNDARTRHDELCALFNAALESRAQAA